MANYANQKFITFKDKEIIFLDSKNPSGKRFLKAVYWEYLEAAAKHLKGENFKVYLYFLSWFGQDEVDYSPTDVSLKWGVGVSTAREALNVLERAGYLEKISEKKYVFYPISHKQV